MSDDANEILISSVIDRMWSVIGKYEYLGLTPYEVARKFGLNHNGAKKVEHRWDGPQKF